MKSFIVAVDGPSASGKSSICAHVCRKLSWTYINTGALYRAVAWLAIEQAVDLDNNDVLRKIVAEFDAALDWDGQANKIFFKGEDISAKIHHEQVSQKASLIAKNAALRMELLPIQRKLAMEQNEGVVLDGRDIGTVVFPDADIKIFLTASLEQRARRRWMQILAEPHDDTLSYEHVKNEIKARDVQDSERDAAPLRKANDYVELNTDHLTLTQSIDALATIISEAYQRKQDAAKK